MKPPIKHYQVIIIGAGSAGIGAAIALTKKGVRSIGLIERNDQVGGIPALYKKKSRGVRTFMRWSLGGVPVFGDQYVRVLCKRLKKTGVEILLKSQVLEISAEEKRITLVNPNQGRIHLTADAFILACGAREKTIAERKWLTGSRPSRVYYTKQLLQMIDGAGHLPMQNPLIIGSDVIAYATSAKLKAAGASSITIIDNQKRPQCSILERLYFYRWGKPIYQGFSVKSLTISGTHSTRGIQSDGGHIKADGIVISGDLIPNSELALLSDLKVELPSRKPVINQEYQLSEPGWFAAGNISGGFHDAEWCYTNGRNVALGVIKYFQDLEQN